MFYIFVLFSILIFTIFVVLLLFFLSLFGKQGIPFVPVEKKYMRKILEDADLKPEDVLCDLGSGDGRVLIEAVKELNIKEAIGVEDNFFAFLFSKLFVKLSGVGNKIKIYKKNFFNLPPDAVSLVTVFYVYLFPKAVEELEKKFFSNLATGTKIICVSFGLKNYEKKFKLLKEEKIGWHQVFYYQKI